MQTDDSRMGATDDAIAAKSNDSRLPRIDREVTTEFQTATFALG